MSDLRIRGLDSKKNANFKAKFEKMSKEEQVKFFDFANENGNKGNKVVDRRELAKAIPLFEKQEAEKLEAQKLEAQKLEAQKLEAQKLEEQKLEAQKLEEQNLEAQKLEAQRIEAERIAAEKKANAFKPFKPIPVSDAKPGTLDDKGIYTTKKDDNLTKIIKGLTEDLKPAELDKLIKAVHADNKSKQLMGEDASSIYMGQKLDLSSIKASFKKTVVTTPATGKVPAPVPGAPPAPGTGTPPNSGGAGSTPVIPKPAITIPPTTKAKTSDVTDMIGKKPFGASFDMTKKAADILAEKQKSSTPTKGAVNPPANSGAGSNPATPPAAKTKTKAETSDVTDMIGKKPFGASFDMTKEGAKKAAEKLTIVKKDDNGNLKSTTFLDPVTKKPVEQTEYTPSGSSFKSKWEYSKDGVVFTSVVGSPISDTYEDINPEDIYDPNTYNKATIRFSKSKDIYMNSDGDDKTGSTYLINGADEKIEIDEDGTKTEYTYDNTKSEWVLKPTTPVPANTSVKTEETFDDKGKPAKVLKTFDKSGNQISNKVLKEDGSLLRSSTFKYNSFGAFLYEERTFANGTIQYLDLLCNPITNEDAKKMGLKK